MGGLLLLRLLWFPLFCGFCVVQAKSVHLNAYHKFSDEVRQWMSSRHGVDTKDWPLQGSAEYYTILYQHDQRNQKLPKYDSLAFYSGNLSVQIAQLGYLYYTFVELGTPNSTLLVALDTGSDLFWVPCDCKHCSSSLSINSGKQHDVLQTYSPSASKTSKPVTCDSELCDLQRSCSSYKDQCPYHVDYASANTSSSGLLVQDILYLTSNDASQTGIMVKAPVTFGCGMEQTGQFLDRAAPYGLLGLGMESISVPSTLSSLGIVPNSFSICFSSTSKFGRFAFGEKGDPDQQVASFVNQTELRYLVSVKEFYVGNATIKNEFHALFDSGTSFAYLASPVYRNLTSNYRLQNSDPLFSNDNNLPFEFCFEISDEKSLNQKLEIKFKFDGANQFSVLDPLVVLYDMYGNAVAYCLAVFESPNKLLSIIGQNFMTGYEIVFDREKHHLGWKEANCSDVKLTKSRATTPSPAVAPSPYPVGPSWVSQSPSNSLENAPKLVPSSPNDPEAASAKGPKESEAGKVSLSWIPTFSFLLAVVLMIIIF